MLKSVQWDPSFLHSDG